MEIPYLGKVFIFRQVSGSHQDVNSIAEGSFNVIVLNKIEKKSTYNFDRIL